MKIERTVIDRIDTEGGNIEYALPAINYGIIEEETNKIIATLEAHKTKWEAFPDIVCHIDFDAKLKPKVTFSNLPISRTAEFLLDLFPA